MRLWRSVAAAALIVGLAACRASTTAAPPPSPDYTGPLYLTPDHQTSATDRQAGAAGRVVSCRTRITGDRDYPDQLHSGAPAKTPRKALKVAYSEGRLFTEPDVYQLERQDEDRALFTHRVDGIARQAVIMHRGPTLDRGRKVGWYVESRARCDWVELPDDVVEWMGEERDIWIGPDGQRAPTYDISSGPGPEHCDWRSMTFLRLGTEPDLIAYVSGDHRELSDYFAEPYRADVRVPGDAVDTGYEREGQQLWLSKDKKRAYVGSREHAELWPRTTKPLGCA